MKNNLVRFLVVVIGSTLLSCGDSQTSQSTPQKSADGVPALSLRTQRPIVSEGESVTVGVNISHGRPFNTELIWEILTEARRFTAPTGSVIITPGSTGTLLDLSTIDNNLYDGEGAVRVRVRDAAGAISPVEINLAIVDNDPLPFLSIGDQEGLRGSRIELAIELSTASTVDTVVAWHTSDVTAEAGRDYDAANGVARIAAGETRAVIGVKTKALARDSHFVVKLTNPENAALADASASVHILPGNSLDTKVSFAAASSTIGEAPTPAGIAVELSTAVGVDVRVDLVVEGDAVAGSDYVAFPLTLTIPAGSTSVTMPVQILDDAVFEREEVLRVRMKTSTNASFGLQTVHTLRIVDNDDPPSISVSDAQAVEGRSLSFAVSLGQVSGADTTFSYMTIAGTAGFNDYATVAGTVTIPAGQTVARVSVPTVQDTLHEATEEFTFALSEANGASLLRATARGSILDDDIAPTVQFATASQTVGVSQSAVAVQVHLSAVSGAAVSVPFHVDGTAIEGVDHNLAAGVITIPAGQISGTLNFSVFRHGPPPKTAIITMDSASGATLGSVIEHTVHF